MLTSQRKKERVFVGTQSGEKTETSSTRMAEQIGWVYSNTGVGKRRFTVVTQINTTIINNNTRIDSVLHTHNCKPVSAHPVNGA